MRHEGESGRRRRKTVVEENWGGAYEFTHNKIGTTWKLLSTQVQKTNLVMPFEHWKNWSLVQ